MHSQIIVFHGIHSKGQTRGEEEGPPPPLLLHPDGGENSIFKDKSNIIERFIFSSIVKQIACISVR